MADADVVVVGGGLSGRAAARRLVGQGHRVVLLEARDRVGGRTHTVEHNGRTVDVGGMWIGPSQRRVNALVREFGLALHEQRNDGKHVVELAGRVHAFDGNISDITGLFGTPSELGHVFATIDAQAAQVSVLAPHLHPEARHWDAISVDEWLRTHAKEQATRSLVSWLLKVCSGMETAQLSHLFWLYFVRQSGGTAPLSDIKGGAQEQKIIGGAQQLSSRLAALLGPAVVRLGEPVVRIRQDPANGVAVETAAGRVWRAHHVVVALPPLLAHTKIVYERVGPARHWLPPLEGTLRARVGLRMPMGSIIKVTLFYARPFWRDRGFSGQTMSDVEPLMLTYDASPPDERWGALVGFIAGAHAIDLGQATTEERRRRVTAALVRFLGREANDVVDYIDKDWSTEEYSGGCYSGLFLPGHLVDYRAAEELRRPWGRVHWASTETATEWFGYMEGALASGEDTADHVNAALRLRTKL